MFCSPPPATRFVAFLLILTGVFSCQREEFTADVAPAAEQMKSLDEALKVQNGLFVFASKEHLDRKLFELNQLTYEQYQKWEKSMGIETHRGAFERVALAEEQISDYYESLPPEEQDHYRKLPPVHSDIYKEMLERKVITLITEDDGSQYWDYAVSGPSLARVLNMDGFVKVGDWITQYTPQGFKIILDGDFSKVEQLKSINRNYKDETFLVHLENGEQPRRKAIVNVWTAGQNDFDYCCSDRKRWQLFIDGFSEPLYGEIDDDCTNFLACINQVRARAQERNFWGNFVYKMSFAPSLSFTNTWSYNYSRYTDNLCGLYKQFFYSVGTYNCTVSPCPTSPHSASYPSVNNGSFNMTPHGNWGASAPLWPSGYGYFSDAFDASGSLTGNYHGTNWNVSY